VRPRRVVRRLLRAALVRWARGQGSRRGAGGTPKVYFLLMHPWGVGGTVRTVMNTASYLARTREVEVLGIFQTRDRPFFDVPAGVTLTTIDDTRAKVRRGRLRRFLERYPSVLFPSADPRMKNCTLYTDVMLARALRRRRAGTLIGTRPGLNLVAAQAGAPSLVKVGQEHMHLTAHSRRLRRAMKRGYRRLDTLAVLTKADRAGYEKFLGKRVRVEQIPNAVTQLGGPEPDLKAKRVLAAGRLARQKDFGRLIRAFALVVERHPDWELRICGSGPRQWGLAKLITELGLGENVVLAGAVRDLGSEMANASIYALSSRREGFPMVLLEAMGKGLAVASFDLPTGPGEIIRDHENGLLVPHQDVPALAAAIDELIEDEQLRRRCGEEARKTAADYSIDVIGMRWAELLSELGVPRLAHASSSTASHIAPTTSIE
jgi:glycosyltransferase involved in cell wall biosynthesis